MNWHNLSDKEFDAKIKSHVEGKEMPFDPGAWDKMKIVLNRAGFSSNGSSWGLATIVLLLAAFFFWSIGNYSGYSKQPVPGISKNNQSFAGDQNREEMPGVSENTPTDTQGDDPRDSESSISSSATGNNNEPISGPQKKWDNLPEVTEKKLADTQVDEPSDSDNAISAAIEEGNNESLRGELRQEDNLPGDSTKTVDDREEAPRNVENPVNLTQEDSDSSGDAELKTEDGVVARPDNTLPVESQVSQKQASTTVVLPEERQPSRQNADGTIDNPTALPNLPRKPSQNGNQQAREGGGATGNRLYRGYSGKSLSPQGPFLDWMSAPKLEVGEWQEIEPLEPPPVIVPKPSHWSLGVTYAPDLSLVGFSKLSKPGTNVAISVDYQFNSRWSIQTGVIYGKKNYVATGRDYTPPKGFWTNGVWPDQTEASCNVIDIPLNIRYYFGARKNHRWFTATGLSTYIMLREIYYYDYDNNDPDLVHAWHVRNENQHVFGVYNLSLGYQRELSSRWLMEIEPFIKAPITGIGFGSVNLWSTGTMFSLRYKFP